MPAPQHVNENSADREKRKARKKRTMFLLDLVKNTAGDAVVGAGIGSGLGGLGGGVYGGLSNISLGREYAKSKGIDFSPELARKFVTHGAITQAKPNLINGLLLGGAFGAGRGIMRSILPN